MSESYSLIREGWPRRNHEEVDERFRYALKVSHVSSAVFVCYHTTQRSRGYTQISRFLVSFKLIVTFNFCREISFYLKFSTITSDLAVLFKFCIDIRPPSSSPVVY